MEISNLKVFFKNSKIYDHCYLFYIIFLICYISYYLFQWPIYAGDTDLWYHLNGGRYILEHGTIPKDSSFFSFIEPPREWVDYYWLFQVIVYKIYTFYGYYGLVFLRALILMATILTIYLVLNRDFKTKPHIYTAVAFSLFVLFLIPRFQLIRPHMFTYLFIVLFIYIFELRPKYVPVLPVISILWINLHGIVYPVMVIITLAYLIEFFINKKIEKKHLEKKELWFVIPIIICIGSVFLTPHLTDLTWVPFIPTEFASLYILEIAKINIEELFSFQIIKMMLPFGTIFNMIFFASCIAIITKIINKDGKRLSHFILFIAAIILLTRANRFRYEFALFSLPILKDFIQLFEKDTIKKKVIKPVFAILVVLFMVSCFLTVNETFAHMPKKFPFSHKNLPEGISTFLNKINSHGRVFNHPNHGGYLQWMLYPKYRIFMDMEIPFLFLNEDIFTANNAFSTETGFNYIIKKYRPQFIIAPLGNAQFKTLIEKYPDYRAVFFDETGILYVDKIAFPEIVNTYELKEIDPYGILYINIEKTIREKRDIKVVSELLRMHNIYPDCLVTNQIMSLIYNKRHEFGESIKYAEKIIQSYPELHMGYRLKADALQGQGQYENALLNYQKALKGATNQVEIYREMGNIYMKQQKYASAYKIFKFITNPFSIKDYKFFYDVCMAAFLSGNIKDAKILFNYGYALVPQGDDEWQEKYLKLAEKMVLK